MNTFSGWPAALQPLAQISAALFLTVLVEAGVGWLLGMRSWQSQRALLLVNAITNPSLNLLVSSLAWLGAYTVRSPLDPFYLVMEGVVVAVEALLLCLLLGKPFRRWALVSAAANTASWFAGALVLWKLLG